MEKSTLKKAKELEHHMNMLEQSMQSFEWKPDWSEEPISLNPAIIIEYDDEEGGRATMPIPMSLSRELVDMLKAEIKAKLEAVKEEFKKL